MTRRYVNALIQHREREVNLLALAQITGFTQVSVPADKISRTPTTYGLGRRLGVFVNAVTSFSSRPLVMVFHLGCLITILAGVSALVLIWRALTGGIGVPVYASLIVSMWFLGGMTIFCVGLVGIYLAKVFAEVKQRPYTTIRADYDRLAGHGP